MFDIGFFEILVIAVVALLVLGPEKMPHAVRMTAAYWGRLKRTMIAAKVEIEDQLALEDIKKQLRIEQEKVQKMMIDTEQSITNNSSEDHQPQIHSPPKQSNQLNRENPQATPMTKKDKL